MFTPLYNIPLAQKEETNAIGKDFGKQTQNPPKFYPIYVL